jgi:TetR/AcrR family transcriptional regulator
MRPVPDSLADRLLPAAAEAFAERGFEGTRLEDLSAASGVPRATLYYYFTGKAEILGFLLSHFVESLSRAVSEAAQSSGTARQRLDRVIDKVLQRLVANPVMLRALVPSFSRVSEVPEIEDSVSQAILAPITSILSDAFRDGELSMQAEDMEATAAAIIYALTFLTLHYQLREDKVPTARIKRSIGRLLDGVLTKA